jgi:superfamily I DNA/RNA helicase
MGKYIEQTISKIPHDEIEAAERGSYPAVLVIVARPYRDQIVSYLESAGYTVDTRREVEGNLNRELGLSILKADQTSNLGWRIVLRADVPSILPKLIIQTTDKAKLLFDIIPDTFRKNILAEVDAYQLPDEETSNTQVSERPIGSLSVRVTSFEGAKGLSAQHVFIAGLHDNELPRNSQAIEDLEICKFIVGLTRTRKSCTLIYTDNFAGNQKSQSCFISWIGADRLEKIKVNATYWRKQIIELAS